MKENCRACFERVLELASGTEEMHETLLNRRHASKDPKPDAA